jgi:transcription-repair coupling factor (superfamily II helicase)
VGGVQDGSLGLLVGTTSVLGIKGWARLGLVVVDEQQK